MIADAKHMTTDTEAESRAKTLYKDIELNFITDFIHVIEDDRNEIVLEGYIDSYNDLDTYFAVVVTRDKYELVTVYGYTRNEQVFSHEGEVLEHLIAIKEES